jgi:hypothetical protein
MRDPFSFEVFALFCAALFVPVVRYVWVPLRLRRNFTLAANSDIQPLDGSVSLPAQVEEFFRSAELPLKSRGFEWLGDRAHTGLTDRVAGSVRMFVNRERRCIASIAVSYLKNREGVWQIKHAFTVFRTDFTDGTTLATSNSPTLQFRPPRPTWRPHRFVNIKDPAVLQQLHEAILERSCAGRNRDLLLDSRFKGDWLAFARFQASEEPKHLLGTGYYWLDESANVLRPTIKGAFMTAWKRSWLWMQWRERKRDRDAARTLLELGLDEQGQPLAP